MEYKKLTYEKNRVIHPPTRVRTILYPGIIAEPIEMGVPQDVGFWKFKLRKLGSFRNFYPLIDSYLTHNDVNTESLVDFSHETPSGGYITIHSTDVTPMADGVVTYQIDCAGEDAIAWSDLESEIPTVLFVDTRGNEAMAAGLITLGKADANNLDFICPIINVSARSFDAETRKLRVQITRIFNVGPLLLPVVKTMYWEATQPYTVVADTAIYMDLLPGVYTVGVIGNIESTAYAGGTTWPQCKRTVVFEVYQP